MLLNKRLIKIYIYIYTQIPVHPYHKVTLVASPHHECKLSRRVAVIPEHFQETQANGQFEV